MFFMVRHFAINLASLIAGYEVACRESLSEVQVF